MIWLKRSRQCVIVVLLHILMFQFAWADKPSTNDASAPNIFITLEKTASGSSSKWVSTYTLNTPAKQMVFVRNPDSSRTTRWSAQDSDIEIVFDSNLRHEIVRSKTGKLLSTVSFLLEPTYKHLGKDYAPFSPFSDGGNLFHTGRLFACIDACTDKDNMWNITLNVPSNEHIVLNGEVIKSSAAWVDKNDGRVIYVGKQKPIASESVVAIIDPGLPESLRASLEDDIPKIMNFFSQALNPIEGKRPALFASYAKVDDHSTQGGTLPNQIFMHWNRNDLEEHTKSSSFIKQTLWFFAHEVAHLYQPGNTEGVSKNNEQSWLHEGSADYFASVAMNLLCEDANTYVENRMTTAFERCSDGLTQSTLANAHKNGHFSLHYSCGMIIHRAIDNVVQEKTLGKESLFTIWKQLQKAVSRGMAPGTETFLTLLQPYNAPELVKAINDAISDDASKAIQGIEALYQMNQ